MVQTFSMSRQLRNGERADELLRVLRVSLFFPRTESSGSPVAMGVNERQGSTMCCSRISRLSI